MKVLMTQAQFDVSMTDLTMSAENRKVARQFLVDGMTAQALKQEGVSPSRLSKIVTRVIENFNKQLVVLGLVGGHYILDEQTAQLVDALETSKVSEAKYKLSLTNAKRKGVKSRQVKSKPAKKQSPSTSPTIDTNSVDSVDKSN